MKATKKMLAAMIAMFALLLMTTMNAYAYGNGEVNWETGTITAEGLGVPNPKFRIPAQQKASAREAAKQAAYAELLATIEGINVSAETNVKDFMMESQTINSKVSGVIRGAKIIKEEWDGTCHITMAVSMYGVSSLSSAVIEPPAKVEPLPAPIPEVIPSVPADSMIGNTSVGVVVNDNVSNSPLSAIGGYTGLIVDCRGLGLNPVMSPVIKNERGISIYGHKNLNYDQVVAEGMVGYAKSVNGASRAGSHPLMIKAKSLVDHNANPVISVADANRILIENGATSFLNNAKVVFLR